MFAWPWRYTRRIRQSREMREWSLPAFAPELQQPLAARAANASTVAVDRVED
jgi:hypothetical protein